MKPDCIAVIKVRMFNWALYTLCNFTPNMAVNHWLTYDTLELIKANYYSFIGASYKLIILNN